MKHFDADVSLVLLSVGVIPIIRCPRRGAAEMLAKKLDGRLRDHVMNSRNNLFSDSNTMNYQRPGQSHISGFLGLS